MDNRSYVGECFVIQDCVGLRSVVLERSVIVIGPENLRYTLQSIRFKLKPIATWSCAFCVVFLFLL